MNDSVQIKNLVMQISDKVAKEINSKASKFRSKDFPYPAQHILESVIEELKRRV
jgi:hypothetical protein